MPDNLFWLFILLTHELTKVKWFSKTLWQCSLWLGRLVWSSNDWFWICSVSLSAFGFTIYHFHQVDCHNEQSRCNKNVHFTRWIFTNCLGNLFCWQFPFNGDLPRPSLRVYGMIIRMGTKNKWTFSSGFWESSAMSFVFAFLLTSKIHWYLNRV